MLVDRREKMKALFFFVISFVHLFYGMTNGIFVSLFNLFLCSCSYCILSYVYKTLKMPAQCTLVHLQMDVLYSFNEIFILHFRI